MKTVGDFRSKLKVRKETLRFWSKASGAVGVAFPKPKDHMLLSDLVLTLDDDAGEDKLKRLWFRTEFPDPIRMLAFWNTGGEQLRSQIGGGACFCFWLEHPFARAYFEFETDAIIARMMVDQWDEP